MIGRACSLSTGFPPLHRSTTCACRSCCGHWPRRSHKSSSSANLFQCSLGQACQSAACRPSAPAALRPMPSATFRRCLPEMGPCFGISMPAGTFATAASTASSASLLPQSPHQASSASSNCCCLLQPLGVQLLSSCRSQAKTALSPEAFCWASQLCQASLRWHAACTLWCSRAALLCLSQLLMTSGSARLAVMAGTCGQPRCVRSFFTSCFLMRACSAPATLQTLLSDSSCPSLCTKRPVTLSPIRPAFCGLSSFCILAYPGSHSSCPPPLPKLWRSRVLCQKSSQAASTEPPPMAACHWCCLLLQIWLPQYSTERCCQLLLVASAAGWACRPVSGGCSGRGPASAAAGAACCSGRRPVCRSWQSSGASGVADTHFWYRRFSFSSTQNSCPACGLSPRSHRTAASPRNAGCKPRLASSQSSLLGWPMLGKHVSGCFVPPSSNHPAASNHPLTSSSALVALKSPATNVGSPSSSACSSQLVSSVSKNCLSCAVAPWK